MQPPAFLRTDLRARAAYAEGAGIYRIVPRAVATPDTTDQLRTLVRWASREGVPLVPRGAGSGMPGGNVGAGVVVDLTRIDGAPLAVTAEGRAHAGAAVTWRTIEDAARPNRLRILPDPSSGQWATVGGMIATNAAGPRTLRYGSVRQWVDAVTLVTADGELTELRRGSRPDLGVSAVRRFHERVHEQLRAEYGMIREKFGKGVRKNTAGYALDAYLESGDLLDLVIGSEGTLGIVTGADWRLDAVPAAWRGLRVALRHREDLPAALTALVPAEPAAVELLDATFLQFVDDHSGAREGDGSTGEVGALLLVEFEGPDGDSVDAALSTAMAALLPIAANLQAATTTADHARLWAIRHAASPLMARLGNGRRSMQVIEDACLPPAALGDYLALVEEASRRHAIPSVAFGHAGDGNIHVNLLPDLARAGWEHEVRAMYYEVSEAVLKLGGVLSGEHGDGRLRAPWLEATYGPMVMMLFRAVKAAFDPAGILNPGVKLPDGSTPISHLKAGSGAVELPADIAAALREIEQSGGYGRWRMEIADAEGGD
jgi:FAD/FMN-containing dehydrogenase